MKPLILACVLALVAVTASAQTPSMKLQWDQSEPLATVQGFQYTLKVDTAPATVIPATCVAQGTGTRCTTPLATFPSGSTHTLVLTAFNGFGSQASDPLTGVPPSKASGMTITVTITIP